MTRTVWLDCPVCPQPTEDDEDPVLIEVAGSWAYAVNRKSGWWEWEIVTDCPHRHGNNLSGAASRAFARTVETELDACVASEDEERKERIA